LFIFFFHVKNLVFFVFSDLGLCYFFHY
jgi:hypothetical protein